MWNFDSHLAEWSTKTLREKEKLISLKCSTSAVLCDKKLLSDMNRHTNTRAGVRGAEAYLYSLTVSMNAAPDMNHDPFHFLSPVEGGYHALTHPLIHTPEILPPPWLCFLPATLCVCVAWGGLCPPGEREGPTSCVRLPLTFHTLPQSARLGLFFPLLLDPSLFLPLYGGLCLLSEAQNTDSFHELNMILKNTTPFRQTQTNTLAP